ncbi:MULTISPECIES: CPBP family intramembrane glutamic endopeptidase [Borrelia]|uniref:CAAX protease n=2 Tax=Borrelia turicatae TaxID=142 RepID=A0A172XBV9_BORTU|nr:MULTISPECIES: type II CAAX endopeptidase family protein [Borrelia]AAX17915.1 CAAX amino terminal protease family [Borrelia turicatae 91E135]ANF34052.1 CAAX protease [Borrelia turicatae]UPA12251.1 CPBP family intramembrane metalloprotease [Borrelia venezuelensis]UPA13423.1 CPBP family intramembrane metalloprotease [Borrelia turicatae 91E135]UPA14907.1 CPBP family intramembrane metalloprotease [Borrelia turicatae]
MTLLNKYPLRYVFLEVLLSYFIVTRISPFDSIDVDLWNFDKNHYYYWLYSTFLILFVVYFSKLTSSYNFRDEFFIPEFNPIFIWQAFLIFVKLLICIFLLLIIFCFILYCLPESVRVWVEVGNSGFMWNIGSKQSLYLMVITSLFTGGVEELFYRAFIITKLKQIGITSLIAALLSSFIFAYGHFYYGFVGFLFALIFGGILSYIYLIHKNIYYSIFVHSFYNIFVSVLLFLLN